MLHHFAPPIFSHFFDDFVVCAVWGLYTKCYISYTLVCLPPPCAFCVCVCVCVCEYGKGEGRADLFSGGANFFQFLILTNIDVKKMEGGGAGPDIVETSFSAKPTDRGRFSGGFNVIRDALRSLRTRVLLRGVFFFFLGGGAGARKKKSPMGDESTMPNLAANEGSVAGANNHGCTKQASKKEERKERTNKRKTTRSKSSEVLNACRLLLVKMPRKIQPLQK